ncbi:MAG: methyl-accepting chemotaxis protein, partial [Helicobacteraceae bacterium]|nr:methyl-accepting chemotaxis protein [Helicobacteraceae bacterium]
FYFNFKKSYFMIFLNTIKSRLIAITAVSVASFFILGFIFYSSSKDMRALDALKYEVKNIEKTILELRRNEKDFLARKDLRYQEKYNQNFEKLLSRLHTLGTHLQSYEIQRDKLDKLHGILEEYSHNFNSIVTIVQRIGLTPKSGLYGSLRQSVHNLEDSLKQGAEYKLQVDMLMLRRAEKDFMLRSDLKYLEKFNGSYATFLADAQSTKHANYEQDIQYLEAYKKDFYALVDGYKEVGMNPKDGALGQMRETIHKSDEALQEMIVNIDAAITQQEKDTLVLFSIVFIGLILLSGSFTYVTTLKINQEVQGISAIISTISSQRDLSIKIPAEGKNEFAIFAKNLNGMFQEISRVLDEAKANSGENSAIAHELSTTSLQVGKNVEQSVQIINGATDKTAHIIGEIQEAIREAQSSKEEMSEANGMLIQARDEIVSLTAKVQSSAESEVELSHRIEQLSRDMDQVKNILDTISDIADQTNLLALNAAIEAARAGEHGRGFAVVADEVRNLAERTQKTLIEINATINVIVQASNSASEQMGLNSEQMETLASISNTVEGKIVQTTKIVNSATQTSEKTVKDFEKTGTSIDVISKQISQINTISSTNARSVEEIASASQHLNHMTESLTNKLEQFRT